MSLVQNFCWGWGGVKGGGGEARRLCTKAGHTKVLLKRNWFLIRLDAGKRDLDIRSVLARQG